MNRHYYLPNIIMMCTLIVGQRIHYHTLPETKLSFLTIQQSSSVISLFLIIISSRSYEVYFDETRVHLTPYEKFGVKINWTKLMLSKLRSNSSYFFFKTRMKIHLLNFWRNLYPSKKMKKWFPNFEEMFTWRNFRETVLSNFF